MRATGGGALAKGPKKKVVIPTPLGFSFVKGETIFSVPFVSMTSVSTNCQHGRSVSIGCWSMVGL
jgi:hypothetical protein